MGKYQLDPSLTPPEPISSAGGLEADVEKNTRRAFTEGYVAMFLLLFENIDAYDGRHRACRICSELFLLNLR